MKALSLTQPWATLVAIGAKRVETRSWTTRHKGLIAIHASKGFPRWAKDLCATHPFAEALESLIEKNNGRLELPLPVGKIVAVANLMGTRFTQDVAPQLPPREVAFGDYSEGRFAWFLDRAVMLPEPIPIRGALGLWDVPDEIATELAVLARGEKKTDE